MNEPLYPKAKVDLASFMRVDAWAHAMLETVAQLRRLKVPAAEIKNFRQEAVYGGNPWATVARWVTVVPSR